MNIRTLNKSIKELEKLGATRIDWAKFVDDGWTIEWWSGGRRFVTVFSLMTEADCCRPTVTSYQHELGDADLLQEKTA